jgi:hypothetical protein
MSVPPTYQGAAPFPGAIPCPRCGVGWVKGTSQRGRLSWRLDTPAGVRALLEVSLRSYKHSKLSPQALRLTLQACKLALLSFGSLTHDTAAELADSDNPTAAAWDALRILRGEIDAAGDPLPSGREAARGSRGGGEGDPLLHPPATLPPAAPAPPPGSDGGRDDGDDENNDQDDLLGR